MEASIVRGLNDKIYDRRKAAAVELEKLVLASDMQRIGTIIDQLCDMFTSSSSPLHSRNGGLIGLAATAIALGEDISPFLSKIIPPILQCFQDPESRLRYHACESLYNIAKVTKGETLVYFNEIFDALSKLSTDAEASVKNGAELLDRLMKDIVAGSALDYVSMYPQSTTSNGAKGLGIVDGAGGDEESVRQDRRAFSLARFIPLLSERIYVISPYTRSHLVSWLQVLDSVPDLELVAWLPDFLDGLLKYLADQNMDVRLATENVLSEFLREIKYIATVQEKREHERADRDRRRLRRRGSKYTFESATTDGDEAIVEESEDEDTLTETADESQTDAAEENEWEGRGSGTWVPGQGVYVDHAAIMDIMIQHLSYPDELVQSTAMEWILTFLEFAQNTVVAFTPRIVPAILPNLASPHRHIKLAAHETNGNLYRVIQALPLQVLNPSVKEGPAPHQPASGTSAATTATTSNTLAPNVGSPPVPQSVSGTSPGTLRRDFALPERSEPQGQTLSDPLDISSVSSNPAPSLQRASSSSQETATIATLAANAPTLKVKTSGPTTQAADPVTPIQTEFPASVKSKRPESPISARVTTPTSPLVETAGDDDPFDVRETVNVLTLQFLSDHAETRIAALEWLLMLHLKAPNKILSRDSGTFPALLKTLSDPSEDVVKHDLQLLAQISASSEDFYFTSFMKNVLELFSTDRRLLETRGSLIIRQLCLHLNAERIFRTIAEILEKDDDLEFASMMVVKLNMILITSPELADFRRRLKSLETKDGQMLFSSLYRSWCHNAVAVFALCLLAQAYEHASNLLQIFAELELTVSLLVQIDKLVMLIESPVFTNLRLQLLEPDKYPYLPKCLYGLLMILPQSSAFVSLRARLSAVYSSGYVPIQPKHTSGPTSFSAAAASATRSKLSNKDEIKWGELVSHFRAVQSRHEKSRRQIQAGDYGSVSSVVHFPAPSIGQGQTPTPASGASTMTGGGGSAQAAPSTNAALQSATQVTRTGTIKKKTGGGVGSRIGNAMSPLNPRRGGSTSSAGAQSGGSGSVSGIVSPGVSIGGAVASMNGQQGLGSIRPISPPGRKRLLGGIRRA